MELFASIKQAELQDILRSPNSSDTKKDSRKTYTPGKFTAGTYKAHNSLEVWLVPIIFPNRNSCVMAVGEPAVKIYLPGVYPPTILGSGVQGPGVQGPG